MLDFLKNFLDLKDAWEQFLENTELNSKFMLDFLKEFLRS